MAAEMITRIEDAVRARNPRHADCHARHLRRTPFGHRSAAMSCHEVDGLRR
jgi:hypothetical protein